MELAELQEAFDASQKQNEEFKAQLESATTETDSMRNKMNELLTEAKKAKSARKDAEALAQKEAEEKAQKAGDFEQLHKSSETARKGLENELDSLRAGIANEKKGTQAMKIAAELADGHNVDLLSGFIANRLKHTDEGVKVLDVAGNLTIASFEDLKTEFQNDAKYASLLKGNQASGGSAAGSTNSGGAATKTMQRAEFDKMIPAKQMEFIKSGGETFD